MNKSVNKVLIPQVTKLPNQREVDVSNKLGKGQSSDFKKLLQEHVQSQPESHGLKLSNHAVKRLNERNLNIDSSEFIKIREGVDKLREKGGKESLIVTNQAAYIVDVDKSTVVTAIDKDAMADNVFTKIDSTVFMN